MRAWQYSVTNKPIEQSLELVHDRIRPGQTLGKSEILVKVVSVGVNPGDYKVAEAGMIGTALAKLPAIPGMDFSGRVVSVGSGIKEIKPDDPVFGRVNPLRCPSGALAEYVQTDYDSCVLVPPGVDMDHAAGIGTAALTAYQNIIPYTKKGERIFIHGGSGGVGTYSIQIAKALGLHVTVSCSTTNVDLCKRLGADEVIDYKTTDLVVRLREGGKRFEHVIDTVGNAPADLYPASKDFLVDRGQYHIIGGGVTFDYVKVVGRNWLLPSFLGGGKHKIVMVPTNNTHEHLVQIADWLRDGTIKTAIDTVFYFEEAPKAFEKVKTGRTKGKIVVRVSDK